jgi:hypothetical protein
MSKRKETNNQKNNGISAIFTLALPSGKLT